MNAYISFFAMPIGYMPYIAVAFEGILTTFNVPPVYQFAVTLNLVVSAVTGTSPLFYYRLSSILPKGNLGLIGCILQHRLFTYFYYFFVYGFCQLVPVPFVLGAYFLMKQPALKQELFEQFRIYYPKFFTDEVILAKFGLENPIVILIFLGIVGGCLLVLVFIVLCTGLILYIINTKKGVMSERNKKLQKNAIRSLISLVMVVFVGCGIFVPWIVFLVLTGSCRTDLVNVIILCSMSLFPLAIGAYVGTYEPYRLVILNWFRLYKIEPVENKIWLPDQRTNVSNMIVQ